MSKGYLLCIEIFCVFAAAYSLQTYDGFDASCLMKCLGKEQLLNVSVSDIICAVVLILAQRGAKGNLSADNCVVLKSGVILEPVWLPIVGGGSGIISQAQVLSFTRTV